MLSIDELKEYYGFHVIANAPKPDKPIIIIHPKSKGSAREWQLNNYLELIKSIPKNDYKIVVTGTKAEGEKIKAEIPDFFTQTQANDFMGKLTLTELISLISQSHALVACSTGPLHIAAALGIKAIGIYPPMKPIHPGRWAPIGSQVQVFVLDKNCNSCSKTLNCECINSIKPQEIVSLLISN
jgi:ADP-heptose:LPS heptosyltransferase